RCCDHPLNEQTDNRHRVVRSGVGQRQQSRKMKAQCASQAEQATKNAEDAAYPAAPDIGWLRIPEYLLEKRVRHRSPPFDYWVLIAAQVRQPMHSCPVVFAVYAHVGILQRRWHAPAGTCRRDPGAGIIDPAQELPRLVSTSTTELCARSLIESRTR